MSERGKRRTNRREKQKEKLEEKEKEKEKEKDRERSRDKEKEKEKTIEDKKMISSSSKQEIDSKEEKKNKNEKILNNILLPLAIDNSSSKELSQYSTIHLNKEALLDLLKCPLCKGYYRTPYTINECMHTFCRSCIFKYFGTSNQREQCPICETKIGGRPMDSLIFDNYLDSLLNILFPKFEEIDKKKKSLLYKTFREAGQPLPGDEEEEKLSMPNIKIYIMPENSKENKNNGAFLVPKNFNIISMKKLISEKVIKDGDLQPELIGVKFKDNELVNNYTMEVVDSQYGFDQDKTIFNYYIKNKNKDKDKDKDKDKEEEEE